ncbi:glycosyltransferase family 2 protein [Clostridium sp. AM58-1XD]|uniref:glycosyltransferase family 2 protein n=1 Tax=Clostridium sp. AM58-1XD TaxID=2292307 RepID=UPI000E557596|nr:glycosyltransferase family 2 protein [Clostridium sp. AM58-1XD]RGY99919.1 glycosyltransferase family 2 protein [Clostridium sp. AM58-1XD]
MKKKVTVIIPNYNGLTFMKPCFQALNKQTYKNFDVLVVDNGSTDGSAEWLKENGVPSIFLEENTGFSGAVNTGIRAASTPYVILLNNDTEVCPDYVKELVRCIERSPKIFSVSSRMIQSAHRELMDDAGDMYSLLGWAYQRGVGQPVKGYKRAGRIFSACAGAAIYRRKVFDEIGYFDEMHFAYLEDMDVGFRAKIAGYDNLYCPTAEVYHVGSGTSGSKYNSFKVKLAARNNIYLNYKNMPAPMLVFNSLPLAAGVFMKYLFFRKIGFGKDYTAGLKEGICTAKKCRKVSFRMENLKNYAFIEWEMAVGTLLYIYEFSKRQLKKFPLL